MQGGKSYKDKIANPSPLQKPNGPSVKNIVQVQS